MKKRGLNLQGMVLSLVPVLALVLAACGSGRESSGAIGPDSGYGTMVSAASALQTTITKRPVTPNISDEASFSFKCNQKKCAYKCQLDTEAWAACTSGQGYEKLLAGAHTFKVKAKDKATGIWDKSPASYTWMIDDGETTFIVNSKKIAAGGSHACVLNYKGGVKCWGWNTYGELGNGKYDSTNVPVQVSGLTSGVTAITAGDSFTCALTSLGGAKCWGENDDGELGAGLIVDKKNVPVNVSGLTSGVAAIAAGRNHVCALTTGGAVKCWGSNSYGQLGDGNTADEFLNVPVQVVGLTSGVYGISAGEGHTCALLATGAVKCWGYGGEGQLGNGLTDNYTTPQSVSGLGSNQLAIASGWNHACSLNDAHGIVCWGLNYSYQIGDGTTAYERDTPVWVSGLTSGISAVASGSEHTCSLPTLGGVKCWGYGYTGCLGNSGNLNSNVPVDVNGLNSRVCAISSGNWFTCALNCNGSALCWGLGSSGQLGTGNNNDSNVPVSVSGFVY